MRPGELHAVIGPNGAGKTTLIGQLSGELAGRRPVLLDGVDVTRMPIERRARCGLARSYQITSVFKPFTALENVAMAVRARPQLPLLAAGADAGAAGAARAALELAGLGRRADVPAARWRMASCASWSWPWCWPAARPCCCWMNPWRA